MDNEAERRKKSSGKQTNQQSQDEKLNRKQRERQNYLLRDV